MDGIRIDLENGYTISIVRDGLTPCFFSVAAWRSNAAVVHWFIFSSGTIECTVSCIGDLLRVISEVACEPPACAD